MSKNLPHRLFVIGLISICAVETAYAGPVTIDFSTTPSATTLLDDGNTSLAWNFGAYSVAFSGYNLFQSGPLFGTRTLTTQGFGIYPITVDFVGTTASMVSFTNVISGVNSPEIDIIEGIAYNVNGLAVASLTTGAMVHWLSAEGIARVVYQNPAGTTTDFDGMTLANFTFQPNALRIPEPSSLALVALAMCVLSSARLGRR